MSIKDQLFLASQYLAPHHLVSRAMGLLADSRAPEIKNAMISRFVRRYRVDMSEALVEDPRAYASFNDFFTRALKPDARPLDDDESNIVSPADGAISQLGPIQAGRIFQAKGHSFGLNALLGGDAERAAPFEGGDFATIYLSPRDYHRVHMPVTGTLREMIHIPGRLFSVNPLTASHVPELFARNERVACIFDTEYGPMALVLVGAMIVASIETVWAGLVTPHKRQVRSLRYDSQARQPITLARGAEMGRFKLGSTVIVLFGPRRIRWLDTPSVRGPIRMGETLALPAASSADIFAV
ncbi:archaetidylserine decarboxylase [Bordetella pseudohinzii]|uniref:Phosphatidylserine decarboxylase proenzyme n=1 Tax=Bordetella pseudohinzii TaxID=1331258 RepID=A0A0J6C7E9_9BORD|nr:archaetidylserine decarboxylase [Bordetella pseudohinzii]ANY16262.1 phosphatidylserine decarboxylase [Bordetella pseudohinzii]KMM25237.1 phosphatidylserine decarboxylase [Bordetella pseudohinzii]KXA75961.1 phosphatidylserine decarboxylase [Bordetella pseudohinzii]KXA77992.1 phosphatidylserine decarboxylase [Bordetella pseudohinzii]CUJ14728.1 Phosphatidylserine decarboxylase proenzyme [Bordetella pseudohinzii]